MEDQLDPVQKVEIALLRAAHQKQFQVQINYLKEQVGAGVVYENAVVRTVVSENGAYYELKDLPEEFGGAVGPDIERRFLSREEVIGLLECACQMTQRVEEYRTRHLALFALYARRGIVDRAHCFVFEYRDDGEKRGPALQFGQFQPDVLPLFFKVRVHAERTPETLGLTQGLLFCMANAGDRHLLVRVPFEDGPVIDLTGGSAASTIH
ncbi:MAG: hypothetical protein RMJ43_16275 [Chloroherpetonaceae bacterium]|nr:hypothetical protein [Chthonomonadaceae bacterium]MDW8209390.1 hypothetical protein [Chloroherpetonaceae bacterium]